VGWPVEDVTQRSTFEVPSPPAWTAQNVEFSCCRADPQFVPKERGSILLQRSTVLPAQGETLRMGWPPHIDVAAQRANRFPTAAKDKPLARWAEGRRLRCLRPQGGALGWENGGLSARSPTRLRNKSGRRTPLHVGAAIVRRSQGIAAKTGAAVRLQPQHVRARAVTGGQLRT
jgi:hypothetical protein